MIYAQTFWKRHSDNCWLHTADVQTAVPPPSPQKTSFEANMFGQKKLRTRAAPWVFLRRAWSKRHVPGRRKVNSTVANPMIRSSIRPQVACQNSNCALGVSFFKSCEQSRKSKWGPTITALSSWRRDPFFCCCNFKDVRTSVYRPARRRSGDQKKTDGARGCQDKKKDSLVRICTSTRKDKHEHKSKSFFFTMSR